MAIALVESQFGPTSTQNLQFLIFLQFRSDFFPQHFMFVGLLFCIPEQAQDRLEIQNFQPRAAAEIWK